MHGRRSALAATLVLLGLGGCAKEPDGAPEEPAAAAPAQAGPLFDAAAAGSIEGRVTWDGPLPDVPTLVAMHAPDVPPPSGKLLTHEQNPFRPVLAADGVGLCEVVVYLRGVDARRARAWPHGPVRIEQARRQLRVVQDGQAGRVGFVRRGDVIEAVNEDKEFHALRVRGAAFFTLPFVEAGRPTRKRLDQTGLIELFSGTGFFWMHAHLFVAEQPYFARTDDQGRFRLEQVPSGRYEVVCWMPSWVVARKVREPESGLVNRLVFAPPVEQVTSVDVRPGAASSASFAWTERQVVRTNAK
jgi:hypothetical protein